MRNTLLPQEYILNNIPDIAWMKDIDSRFIAVNEAFLLHCDIPKEEIIGKSDFDIWPRVLAEQYRACDMEVIRTGDTRQTEEWLEKPDGTRMRIETIKIPYWNNHGDIIGTIGIARDITQRRKMENDLRDERDFSSRIIRYTPALVCGITPEGLTTFVNPAVEATTGYKAEELIHKNWWHIFYPGEEYRQVEQLFCDFEKSNVQNYEMTLTTRLGEKKIISWNSINRYDETGRITEIIGFGIDITQQKKKAETLTAHNEKLERLVQHRTMRLQQALEREKLANEITRNICEETNLDLILQLTVNELGKLINADRCIIWVYDHASQTFHPSTHEYLANHEIPSVVADHQLNAPIALFLNNASDILVAHEYEFKHQPDLYDKFSARGVKSLLHVPIVFKGNLLGVLCAHSITRYETWDSDTVALVKNIADQISIAIHNATIILNLEDAKASLEHANTLISAVSHLQSEFIQGPESTSFFSTFLEQLLTLSKSEVGLLGEVLYDEDHLPYIRTLALSDVAWGFKSRQLHEVYQASGLEFHKLENLLGTVIRTKEVVISNTLTTDPKYKSLSISHPELTNYIGIPIHGVNGIIGIIAMTNRHGGYQQELLDFLHPLLVTYRHIIEAVKINQKRLEAEKHLQENEKHYSLIVEGLNDVTVDWDMQKDKLSFNSRFYEITGIPHSAVQQASAFQNIIHPDDLPMMIEKWTSHIQTNAPFQVQYRLRHAQGHYLVCSFKGKVILDEYGVPSRLAGVFTDITEQKNAEEALKNSELRFRTLAESAPMFVCIAEPDGQFSYFNQTWHQFTGLTKKEASQLDLRRQLIHPDDLNSVLNTFNRALEDHTSYSMECRYLRYDGEYRWVLFKGSPKILTRGKFGGFIVTGIDITERKESEEKLRDSEVLFRTIANTPPTTLWMTDEYANTTYVNNHWLAFTGSCLEDNLGDKWLRYAHPDDQEMIAQKFKESFQKRQLFKCEFRLKTKAGFYRWLLSTGAPRYLANGQFAGYVGSCMDITDRIEMEIALQQAKEEAENANRKKSQFLANMSHELRTPLHTIISGSSMCLEGMLGKLNERQEEYLNLIYRSGEHLLVIINDLLDIEKIEAGKFTLNLQDIDLKQFIEEAVQLVEPLLKTKSQQLILHLSDGLPEIFYGDPTRLKQVICNLFSNAHKFTDEGHCITFSCTLSHQEDILVFSVEDEGVGISESDIERIMLPFEQGTQAYHAHIKGTGLGLPLAKKITELHHGKLEISSQLGQGSIFSVHIPLHHES